MDLRKTLMDYNICEENEYLDKYLQLVNKNMLTEQVRYETELHHVVPVCYYAQEYNINRADALKLADKDSNNFKVNMSHSDHVLAHIYLAKCSRKEVFRLAMLYSSVFTSSQYHIEDSDLFSKDTNLQREYQEAITQLYKDRVKSSTFGMKGKKHTEEARAKQSLGHKEYYKTHPAITPSESGLKALHDAAIDTTYVHKEGVVRRIKKSDVNSFLSEGWKQGRGKPKQTIITKDGVSKYIPLTDLEQFISDGWSKGSNLQGIPKTEDQKAALRGIKKRDTSNMKKKKNIVDRDAWMQAHKNSFKGTPRTEEQKQQAREKQLGKRAMHKGMQRVYVSSNDIDRYLTDGWLMGWKD